MTDKEDAEAEVRSLLESFLDDGALTTEELNRVIDRRIKCVDCGQNAGLNILRVRCDKDLAVHACAMTQNDYAIVRVDAILDFSRLFWAAFGNPASISVR